MTNEQLIKLLFILLVVLFFVLIGLAVTYIFLKFKNTKKEKKEKVVIETDTSTTQGSQMIAKKYTKESIFNFMEFDRVEDNMIVQKNGSKFLMIVECQGVNYDLMSEMEKISVEEGFQEFLNTLRSPIQIYTQTRSVNLEGSLASYRDRLKKVEDKLNKLNMEYDNMRKSNKYTKEQLDAQFFEITKQRNLFEYGKDIIFNTEKMSLNKNVLNKHYYVVVSYYTAELGNHNFDKEEVKNIAFTELYTKAQSVIRALAACDVNSRILTSRELVELLYMSYNRDEAEIYGMDKIIKSDYEELYSTAPDVFERKIRELQNKIEQDALEKANNIVDKVYSKNQREYIEKEEKLDDLINDMTEAILKASESNLGKDLTEKSIEELKKQSKKEKGGRVDDIQEKAKRGRKPRQSSI